MTSEIWLLYDGHSIIILIDFSYFFSSFSFPGEQNHTKQIQHDSTESYLGHTPHQYWGKFHLLRYLFWTKVILYKSRDELFSWKQNSRFGLVLGRTVSNTKNFCNFAKVSLPLRVFFHVVKGKKFLYIVNCN